MEDLLDFLKKYRAGFITNLCVFGLPFTLLLGEVDRTAGSAPGFAIWLTFLGLMAFDIVCGIVAMFMRSKTKEEDPLPSSYNFFLGCFLAGLFLFLLLIVIFGALNAFM